MGVPEEVGTENKGKRSLPALVLLCAGSTELLTECRVISKVPLAGQTQARRTAPKNTIFPMDTTNTPTKPLRVWDLPTRVFHWALLAAVVGAFITAKLGGNAMVWHMRLGLFISTLLLWRLVWGLVGGHYSRFASFMYHPSTVLNYLKGKATLAVQIGHNPLGAFSVFGLLAVLMVQAATGWIADDEIANLGPAAKLVSQATALAATGWHKHYGEWLMLSLVVLHACAIAFYEIKQRHRLIKPMWQGDKQVPADEQLPASRDDAAHRIKALVLWCAIAAGVTYLVQRLG
jgi:cytochrome b